MFPTNHFSNLCGMHPPRTQKSNTNAPLPPSVEEKPVQGQRTVQKVSEDLDAT